MLYLFIDAKVTEIFLLCLSLHVLSFTCFLSYLFLCMPPLSSTAIRKTHTRSSFSREILWLIQS